MPALVREAFLIESLEDDLDLLLEQLAVGGLVDQRRTKTFHLAGMVPASHAKYDAAMGKNVRHRVVLGQTQRMPHRCDVEAAADAQVLREMRQVQRHQQHIGNALGAFGLEVMLRHPVSAVAQAVHQLRHFFRFAQGGGQLFVRVAAIVDRRAAVADVLQVDMAGI